MRRTMGRLVALAGCAWMGVGCSGGTSRYDFQSGTLHPIETFEHDGAQRRFRLYASATDGALPLVVVLHGGGATLESFINEDTNGGAPFAAVWLNLADDEGFHLLIPEGLDKQWNGCRADCEHCGEADDTGYLRALIDEVSGRVSVDPTRVHFAGESNGGFMAQRMAQEHGADYGAVGVVNAAMPANSDCADSRAPTALIYVVGTEDTIARWEGGQASSEDSGVMLSSDETMQHWIELDGCSAEPTVESMPDIDTLDDSTVEKHTWTCPAPDGLVRFKVNGGGHVPPSIEEPTSAAWNRVAGQQNRDIETAHEMWRFFQQHPLGG